MRKPARFFGVAVALGLSSQVAVLAQQFEPSFDEVHTRSTRALESNPELSFDPHTVLVRFHEGTPEHDRQSLRQMVGRGRLVAYATVPDLELIEVTVGVETAIQTLAPHVGYVEPNFVQRKTQIPNDTYFGLEWGMHNTGQSINGTSGVADADIDAVEAWDITTGDANFKVAIIDTGTDWDHPDLAANIWSNPGEASNGQDDDGNGYVDDLRGWDFYSNDNNPDDADGHGSHTAGTVGAVGNNGVGVAGVNWQCNLIPLRFLGPQGGYTSDAILAVEYCTTNDIKISNNSWGGGGYTQSLYDAIDASRSIDHVFVAAAGNDGTNNDVLPHYPSNYTVDNILSVAATDNQDGLADEGVWGSNYGANSVDLGAPGVDIASTWSAGGYVWSGGTSMATPHVAGVCALVYAQNPGWSYAQVRDRILNTVRPLPALSGLCTTGGMLNALAAVDGGGPGGDTTPPAAPTGLSATGGDGSVALDWANNGEPDLASYSVYRSTSSGGGYGLLASGLGASAYTDNAVTNGTTYYYVVTASDTSGNESGSSAEASATPTDPGGPGQTEAIYSDGFESGDLNAGGWSYPNTWASAHAQAARTGSFGARLRRSTYIEVAVSTVGYESVELRYSRRTRNLDNGEELTVSYFNGSSWVVVETTQSTSWADRVISLGADADDNGALLLRFQVDANRNNERADVDDVELIGTTL